MFAPKPSPIARRLGHFQLLVALFVLFSAAPVSAQCGGTERWQVKVGTDSGVNRVQLTPRIDITIHDLIHLTEPTRPPQGDNDTRLDDETHVYQVFGRLVKFKREAGSTGDRDFHLVVSDDTLIFTDDNVGTPAGHSVVAEIPDPQCVPGQHGNPAVPSRFINETSTSRAALEAQFPNLDPTGNWNDAGRIPVRIVGVGFFDFPHHQAGRALNNIELHPVLEIEFNPSTTPQPAPTPTTGGNLLQNGGFEDGSTAWVTTAGVITSDAGEPAHQGTMKAWLGGYGTTHTDTLYQKVAIPPGATTATLTFFLHITTEEDNSAGKRYDTLKLQIRDSSGHVLATPATFSNLDAASGFQQQSVDLTTFSGKTVRIYFVGKEDGRKLTSFVLDDFQLTTQ